MPHWCQCLSRWAHLLAVKEHARDHASRIGSGRVAVPARMQPLEERCLFNAVPIAEPDTVLTPVNTSLDMDYLAWNDTDADGDTLTVTSVTGASHGSITNLGGGAWRYTPSSGYTGQDALSYTVSDGNGGTATGSVAVAVNAAVNETTVRNTLLAGVSELGNPGGPGYAVAYGPTAVSVAQYDGQEGTMLAAGTLGAGKVVAYPDHQWLDMDRFDNSTDMHRLYENSIEWLSGTASKSVKVVVMDSDNQSELQSRGFTNVVLSSWGNLASNLNNADVLITGWMGSNPAQSRLDTVADYTRDGGGLMIAEYGQGYDWWWAGEVYEAPGNRLLREAGIGFASGNTGEYTPDRTSGLVNAETLIAILNDSSGYSADELAQAGHLLAGAGGVLDPDDTLLARIDRAFLARIGSVNPTPATPVSDPFDQALLTREMQLIRDLPADEVTAHRTAEDVYGAIDPQAPRLNNQAVTLDTSISGIHATGYYAAPGELVTVTVPSALVGRGYTVRISTHVDNISGRNSWNRMPFGIARTYQLDSSTVQVAGAFGGHVYIDLGGRWEEGAPNLGDQTITISGAMQAPTFVLGETTDAQWDTIRDYPAPYADFVSEHVAFNLPSEFIRDLDNPTELMQAWDEAIAFQDWVGAVEDIRTAPDRINIDVQISVGYLHAGYPTQGPTGSSPGMVDLDYLRSTGTWGWFHELGHMHQTHPALGWGYNNPWTFPGDVEVTVNIFSNAAMESFAGGRTVSTNGWGYSSHPDLVMSRAASTVFDSSEPDFDSKDPYPFYFQLADGPWGWQGYRDVMTTYVQGAQNNPGGQPSGEQAEKDQWYIRWSEETGYDMTTYMVDHWKLEVSNSAKNTVAAMNLPEWMPLATTLPESASMDVAAGDTLVFDLGGSGLGLDGVATFVSSATSAGGTLTDQGGGNWSYEPVDGFTGTDTISVTYRSSAGNTQSFPIAIEVVGVATGEPVAHWKFDEFVGREAQDATGNGWTGTLIGGVRPGREGVINKAFAFNGRNGEVQVGTPVELTDTSMTVSAWVKTRAFGSDQVVFEQGGGWRGHELWISSFGKPSFSYRWGPGNAVATVQSDTSILDGDWHLLTGTVDADTGVATLYLDGVSQGTRPVTVIDQQPGQPAQIGYSDSAAVTSGAFSGRMDDVRLYADALDGGAVFGLFDEPDDTGGGGLGPGGPVGPGTVDGTGTGNSGAPAAAAAPLFESVRYEPGRGFTLTATDFGRELGDEASDLEDGFLARFV